MSDPRVKHMKQFGAENIHWLSARNPSEWRQLQKTAPWFVYTLYEADGRITVPIYVGVSNQFHERLAHHRRQRAWWPLVGPIAAEPFSDRYEAYDEEHDRIVALTPLFNLAWNVHTPRQSEDEVSNG